MNPLAMRGALKRLSPEEPWFAKVLRLGEVIRDGADDETLMRWKSAMLGASWQFELYENAIARPTEGALERAINLRTASCCGWMDGWTVDAMNAI